MDFLRRQIGLVWLQEGRRVYTGEKGIPLSERGRGTKTRDARVKGRVAK